MNIPIYINTRTYNINNNNSTVSIVEDLKNHILFILKNNLSDKWNEIISNQKYNTKDLENFLYELTQEKHNKSAINTEDKNFKYFEYLLTNLLTDNKIISALHLELNYKCNQNCKHCFNPKNMDKYSINFDQAKKIIDEAYDIGIYEIILTGGESTINKDFLKIAKYIREKHMPVAILSNGQKLYDDENLFNELINIYPKFIKLSLYSMDSNEHDYITGIKGSHYKTLNLIKKLKNHNIKVKIDCPQFSYNVNSYKNVKQFADEIGASFATGCTFIYNKENHNFNAKLDSNNILKFHQDCFNPSILREKYTKSDGRICGAGHNKISIRPNLDITPCVGFNYILGSYNSISLKELKENVLPKFQKKFIKSNLKECFKEEYCQFCLHCPIYTTHENNSFLKKSKILCEDAKAYYKAYLKYTNKKI